MNLEQLLITHIQWSRITFGDTRRTEAIIEHIKKELEEIQLSKGNDVMEWIDVMLLALDGAWRCIAYKDDNSTSLTLSFATAKRYASGIDDALYHKSVINWFLRKWPIPDKDKPSEHIKYNGLACSICNSPQFLSPGGATCEYGHGGVDGIPFPKVHSTE